jgi:hypothetical protein
MHARQFRFDLRVFELGSVEVVLGVDWMKQFCPVKFDYEERRVSFKRNGERVDGSKSEDKGGSLKLIEGTELVTLIWKNQVKWLAHMFEMETKSGEEKLSPE